MADALGCTVPTYSRYERGAIIIPTENLGTLYYMGCNISWLITGKETMGINEIKTDDELLKILKNNSEAILISVEASLNDSIALKNNSESIKEQTSIIKMLASKTKEGV